MEVELSGVKWSGMERNVVTLDGKEWNAYKLKIIE